MRSFFVERLVVLVATAARGRIGGAALVIDQMTRPQLEKLIAKTTRRMKEAAKQMDFMQAAQYRDEIIRMQKELELK